MIFFKDPCSVRYGDACDGRKGNEELGAETRKKETGSLRKVGKEKWVMEFRGEREAGEMTEFFTTLRNILQQKIARCTDERDIKDGLNNRE